MPIKQITSNQTTLELQAEQTKNRLIDDVNQFCSGFELCESGPLLVATSSRILERGMERLSLANSSQSSLGERIKQHPNFLGDLKVPDGSTIQQSLMTNNAFAKVGALGVHALNLAVHSVMPDFKEACNESEFDRYLCDAAIAGYEKTKELVPSWIKQSIRSVQHHYQETKESIALSHEQHFGVPAEQTRQGFDDTATIAGLAIGGGLLKGASVVGTALKKGVKVMQPATPYLKHYYLYPKSELVKVITPSFESRVVTSTATPAEVNQFFLELKDPKFRNKMSIITTIETNGYSILEGNTFRQNIYTSAGLEQMNQHLKMLEVLPKLGFDVPKLLHVTKLSAHGEIYSVFTTKITGTPLSDLLNNFEALRTFSQFTNEFGRLSRFGQVAVGEADMIGYSKAIHEKIQALGKASPYTAVEASALIDRAIIHITDRPLYASYMLGRTSLKDILYRGPQAPIGLTNLDAIATSVSETGLPKGGFLQLDRAIIEKSIQQLAPAETKQSIMDAWKSGNPSITDPVIQDFVKLIVDLDIY